MSDEQATIPDLPAGAETREPAATLPDGEPGGAWQQDDDLQALPPRPRRRLLSPLPVALLCVLLTACGFIGGVLVQKGQGTTNGSTSGTGGFASRLAALRGGGGTGSSGGSGGAATGSRAAGVAALFGGGGPTGASATVGQVSFVQGGTLYVTNAEGNTVKVHAPAGTTVTKTVSSSTKAIHPGETVVVTGAAGSDGAVTAEAIRVGTGAGGLASLFGGAARSGASGSEASSSGSSGSGAGRGGAGGAGTGGGPALFGPG
jgi:hypothetical protein